MYQSQSGNGHGGNLVDGLHPAVRDVPRVRDRHSGDLHRLDRRQRVVRPNQEFVHGSPPGDGAHDLPL